jgi:osmotically-inducible protein OsmY
MVAFSVSSTAPDPRNPLLIADDVRHALKVRSPKRFSRVNVRVANGAVALTGSVPNQQSKSLALFTARSAFPGTRIIDALEVQNRRSFARLASCA